MTITVSCLKKWKTFKFKGNSSLKRVIFNLDSRKIVLTFCIKITNSIIFVIVSFNLNHSNLWNWTKLLKIIHCAPHEKFLKGRLFINFWNFRLFYYSYFKFIKNQLFSSERPHCVRVLFNWTLLKYCFHGQQIFRRNNYCFCLQKSLCG